MIRIAPCLRRGALLVCLIGRGIALQSAAAEDPSPRHYACPRTDLAPAIDGRLDDAAWQAADWSTPFVNIEGTDHAAPPLRTRLRMLWDADFLYIAAELQEPHVWGTLTNHDEIVFQDNDFEIFIDPDGDGEAYYEVEINALNTIFDLFLVRPYRKGGPALHGWDLKGLKSAVHVEGTLNDPSDEDVGWSIEMAMPWSALGEAAGTATPPKPGDIWRMNFSRVQWQHRVTDGHYEKQRGVREQNWVWSPQGVIDMHRPERWGRVVFEGQK